MRKREVLNRKKLISKVSLYTLDDSNQGYYVGNENTTVATITIDSFECRNRNREHLGTVFLGKV